MLVRGITLPGILMAVAHAAQAGPRHPHILFILAGECQQDSLLCQHSAADALRRVPVAIHLSVPCRAVPCRAAYRPTVKQSRAGQLRCRKQYGHWLCALH